jgi:adenine-specific DNA-methyltransferase
MAKATISKKKPIEQYDHKGKKRINNPPVGLVTPQTDRETAKRKYAYDPHIDPALQFDSQRSHVERIIDDGLSCQTVEEVKEALRQLRKRQAAYLNWSGKAERNSFEVPTVSLHVHERIDPRAIIEAVRRRNGHNDEQMSLFQSREENPPLREAIEFYKHPHNWSNRLIAGDSLLVMNSLLEKEGMAGQVQMIYIDPPYGIRYGSNFQPFVNNRDVKDGKDEDLTQEPEMIKAFRDTWELGIHSYLSYLRDRLLLARELLSETGSLFIQIGDENLHLVRNLLDEIFAPGNFLAVISFQTKIPLRNKYLPGVCDYLLWYGKDFQSQKTKFRRLFIHQSLADSPQFSLVQMPDGLIRPLNDEERADPSTLPQRAKIFASLDLTSSGRTESCVFDFTWKGKKYSPTAGKSWKTNREGMEALARADRLYATKSALRYKLFLDDYPVKGLTNNWTDTVGVAGKVYVVQTDVKAVARCMLMTTDPGDLVFDPTCGSGTTAFVAEQLGRRWITCDTSRVAVTLAKQRLMTAAFEYYELARPDEGVGSGFKYKSVPHITLGSITNNEPPAKETLYDEPYIDNSKGRVTGPFTVEAVPAPLVKTLVEIKTDQPADESVARSGETLRQAEWRDELLKSGIRGKKGQYILFSRVEPLPGTRWLHAEAETKPNDKGADRVKDSEGIYGKPQRVVISFGPEHAPLEQKQVELAIEEAQTLVPKPKIIVFAAFQFDPEAAKDIDETDWPGVTLLKAQMNADLLTEDLKKKRASNESFWLIGQPDITFKKIKDGDDKGKYRVEVMGFDYYNTKTGTIESGGNEKIAMWMLDTDYDGRSLLPRQVFFPMAGENDGWARLARNLKAEIDEELIEKYRGTVSLPFEAGKHKRIAVKIVDDRGIESLRILDIA